MLYGEDNGTPCEASARALYPNRFREMDKLHPHGIAVKNPAGASQPY